ncbi:MAG TPA: glutamate dehydrogenase, partial [Thermodesulfobacteriota bacterium]|nr:glutamate dehydrogenase [Thermodesulfobacteriota bacterium]
EATGYGVAYIVEEALGYFGRAFSGASVSIQGFGNVGTFTALKLSEMGCRIIALSDVYGGIYNPSGLPVDRLVEIPKQRGRVQDFKEAERITNEELLTLECDVLIPAAVGRVITKENAPKLRCKMVVEAANGPTTTDADDILEERGIPVVPDILANAGGVIVSYFEWVQGLQEYYWSKDMVFMELKKRMQGMFRKVSHYAKEKGISLRMAALMFGINQVAQAKKLRGLYP